MSRTNLAILIGLVPAALIAWGIGGSVGVGVLGGYLLATSVCGVGYSWQRTVVRAHPERSLNTLVVLMLVKLVVVLAIWVALRFVEGAGDVVDARGFLLTFVAAVLLVSLVGSFEALSILKERKAHSS